MIPSEIIFENNYPVTAHIIFFINDYLIYSLIGLVGLIIFLKCKTRFLDYCFAVIVALGASELIKFFVDKPRPLPITSSLAFEGGSFPSTHTAIAFTVAFFYLLVCHRLSAKSGRGGKTKSGKSTTGEYFLLIVIFLASILVGVFRVVVKAHYPVDVLAGVVLGFLVALPFRYYDLITRRKR
ncbi:hypothetical protein A2982_03965 [candidate division WWE3 bacterium RIFCSPLOWO2_01_FULL_39_13]|uniref:Phosphatidic acid phosphatase type 2/haloperoxidase domain-containing protein n=1 Tax=candidate division WWE3 bacterium RIFCSPLOWO2_01_FULL_39_13 TaxID=1802624 RepID=A0A1F4V3S4_UNCKA|nr:MAG: hypothetical protein A2982_03965 [candidate division WWE3 bacterium RIFCSPLOWO2_01_FULL_39_13]